MCPLPGTRVLHEKFQAAHRPVADSTMTVTVAITRPGTGSGTFDPVTGTTTGPARTTVATCRARVQATAMGDRTTVVAGQVVTLRSYTISVPISVTGVRVDDQVQVTKIGKDDDPDLLTTMLRVRAAVVGSIAWQRDLAAEEDLG